MAGEEASTDSYLYSGLAAGAVSLIGGFVSNQSSARQAQKNRDHQLYMSNTAHQREMADLSAAGLNPILTATGGPGASTGSGSSAPQSDIGSPAVHSALAASRNRADLKNLGEQNKLLQDQQRNTQANTVETNTRTKGLAFDNISKNLAAYRDGLILNSAQAIEKKGREWLKPDVPSREKATPSQKRESETKDRHLMPKNQRPPIRR
jgi:hypothetical protein